LLYDPEILLLVLYVYTLVIENICPQWSRIISALIVGTTKMSTNCRMDKVNLGIHITEHFLAIEKNECLIHATTWMIV
jgi:hypothetical protein